MNDINKNQPVFQQVSDRVKQYPYGAGRAQIAGDFRISKSTAQEHLEKCVARGLLLKFYGWITRTSRGWVYIDPEQQTDMIGDFDPDRDEGVLLSSHIGFGPLGTAEDNERPTHYEDLDPRNAGSSEAIAAEMRRQQFEDDLPF